MIFELFKLNVKSKFNIKITEKKASIKNIYKKIILIYSFKKILYFVRKPLFK